MRFTLLVLTPPDAGASPRHALQFARAALAGGHDIDCVFFFDAGVLTALDGAASPADEENLRRGWDELQRASAVRLLACIASAERFGVVAACESDDSVFALAGLGDLVDSSSRSDRLLTFSG